jgi:hypothetical protein
MKKQGELQRNMKIQEPLPDQAAEKPFQAVIPSADFMILRLTTVHENPRSAGILPAAAGHRALDDVAGRMPALPFSWQSLMPVG